MSKHLAILFVNFILLISISNSYAAIVSVNDTLLGTGSVTRDTSTGLEWLDIPLTADMSWNEAVSTYSLHGFRHATLAELETFFRNAGIPDIGTGTSSANYAPSVYLQNLIGGNPGFISTEGISTFSSFGWTAIVDGYSELSWINKNDTDLISTVIVNSNNIFTATTENLNNFSHPARSHWMVRPVPLPASVWLFIAAFTWMAGLLKK